MILIMYFCQSAQCLAWANLEFVTFLIRSLSAGITGMHHNAQLRCALPGVCLCLWVRVHMCVDVRGGQSAVLGVLLIYSPSSFFMTASLTDLGRGYWTGLAD